MTLGSFLLDLILVIVIGVSAYLSARRGFVRTFIEAIGFVVAAVLAFVVSTPFANLTYDKLIEPPLTKLVSSEVTKTLENEFGELSNFEINSEVIDEFKTQFNGSLNEVVNSLPSSIQNLIKGSGIAPEEILQNTEEIAQKEDNVENATQRLILNISQNKIKPIVAGVISYVYWVALFVILLILIKIIARFLNKAFSFSLVGTLNTTLGGACGFIKGVVVALLLCLAVYSIVSFTENGIWIFSMENIDKTFIFKYLVNLIKI